MIVNDAADVLPPVVKSMSVLATEQVVDVRVIADDASDICTVPDWADGNCVREPVAHIAFEGAKRVDSYVPLERLADGSFRLAVPVTDFSPGTYQVVLVNTIDVWGNASSDLSPDLRPSFRIDERNRSTF